MSAPHAVEVTPTVQPSPSEPRQNRALARLEQLKRALQRQLRRRPTDYEKCVLDRAALLTLRAEIAAHDPRTSSNDLVRLDNVARRARRDFERIAQSSRHEPTLAEVMRDAR